MPLSKRQVWLISPAVLAELSIAFAIYESARMVAGVEAELRPAFARDFESWVLWIAFWQSLRFALTGLGLLTTRPFFWWVPIAAVVWELYAFSGAIGTLFDHILGMSELFTVRFADFSSVLFRPFVVATIAPFLVIPTLAEGPQ